MKRIVLSLLTDEDGQKSWTISFNGKTETGFASYGAALLEAMVLLDYCAFMKFRGESTEGAEIIRIDEVVDPDTKIREQVEAIVDETDGNGIIKLRLERWSLPLKGPDPKKE
jgi:hypothetical protein